MKRIICITIIVMLSAIAITLLGCRHYYLRQLSQIDNASFILISKQEMKLNLIDYKGNVLFQAPIAIGKNPGNKKKQGDMRTPEGVFQVEDIQKSAMWKHDFGDGKGEIEGAYGPYFIRLKVPGHKGIGIHGTHLPQSIGSLATEGCIRLRNEDLEHLVSLIYPPMTVIITPSVMDECQNSKMKK